MQYKYNVTNSSTRLPIRRMLLKRDIIVMLDKRTNAVPPFLTRLGMTVLSVKGLEGGMLTLSRSGREKKGLW